MVVSEDGFGKKPETLPAPFLSGIKYEHLVAGMTGGVISTLVTHPFDLIKLRFAVHDGMETRERPRYRGLLHATRTIFREDGFLGLYRGASANVVGAGASWGLYFFFAYFPPHYIMVEKGLLKGLRDYNTFKFHTQGGNLNQQLSAVMHLLCASCAGMLTLTLTNPIWVVKTRLCLVSTDSVPGHMRYRGLGEGLANLYRYEGIRGLYKGYVPGLFGTSHGAIQFMVYEELKKSYCNYFSIPITTQLGPLEYVTMAATSKVIAVAVTYPYQVIRARLQDQEQKYSGVMDIIKRVARFEGPRGFYKGLTANLAKVVPATCITFVVYEYMSAQLLKR